MSSNQPLFIISLFNILPNKLLQMEKQVEDSIVNVLPQSFIILIDIKFYLLLWKPVDCIGTLM